MTELQHKKCVPCEGGVAPLNHDQTNVLLAKLHDWNLDEANKYICKDFKFKGFYKTIAFVNAIAWIANQQSHHPDLEVGYDHCLVKYSTHAIDGLSENDFICAAKIDLLSID